ncbi:MAG: 3-deoxy-7-phosphoheptulonate synthase [Myxococcota bacterium]|nr:3-deoxy-7-phosphoheptulonate synthase [Myxococcota bacterium]
MFSSTDDVRIEQLKPLIPPAILMEELPIFAAAEKTVKEARQAVGDILEGKDKRLLVVVGPCSIHDPHAAIEYGERLGELRKALNNELFIVMRVYFEKPRTTIGWKGLINDPHLNNSFAINSGLRIARKLLLDLLDLGVPPGTEFLDTISPQFIADLVSWGAIGARTTESQIHRELASGLSMPVGFKNGTDGNTEIAIAAIQAANNPHHFLSVTKQSIAAIVATKGNPNCHVILRGSNQGPNFGHAAVAQAAQNLQKAGLTPQVMVDCSHGNSRKRHKQQIEVVSDIQGQLAQKDCPIMGIMLESNLQEGRQNASPGQQLAYGQSITDACLGWDDTVGTLESLANSLAQR